MIWARTFPKLLLRQVLDPVAYCRYDEGFLHSPREPPKVAGPLHLNETPMTLGPVLQMDAKTETFTNNDAANAMLPRKFRKDFEISKTEN